MPTRLFAHLLLTVALLVPSLPAAAEDWPEVYGAGRRAEWREQGILRQFPAGGLTIRWRTPVGAGYGGPSVAGGKVFIADYQKRDAGGAERVLCLDEQSGKVLWVYENPKVNYSKFAYNNGPRSNPTVEGNLLHVLGAAGDLYCLSTQSGELKWHVSLLERFGAKTPTWGFAASPLVYGDLVITPAGGSDNSRLVGLSKLTGETVWKSLPASGDAGYSSPVLIRAGGVDQLLFWVNDAISSHNPLTGEVYWEKAIPGITPCALPVSDGSRLFISNFYKGTSLLKLAADKPEAELVWSGKGENEVNTQGLHALMGTPVIKDGHLYGFCSYGQFRCLDASNGERVWENADVTREIKRWATAFVVRNGDVYFMNNDRGELIIADLQPTGYRELSRTQLIQPTSGGAGARELGKVNWVIPAYANRHIIIRNDEEIIRASLEQ